MAATDARRELEVDAAVLAIAAGLIHAVAAEAPCALRCPGFCTQDVH